MLKKILTADVVKISALFVVWRVSLLVFGLIALTFLPKVVSGQLVNDQINFWNSWANWDGGHFLGIAENGYRFIQQYAFFPFLPLIISTFAKVLKINFLASGLIISNFAALISFILFYKLLRLDFNKNFSLKSLNYFLFFPTIFYLGAVYAESIFISSALASFYFLRKRNFLIAALSIIVVTLTKPYGILILIPLVVEYFSAKKKEKINLNLILITLLPVLFLCFYLTYLKNVTGDPFIFIKSQQNWLRTPANPVSTLWSYYSAFFTIPINLFFGIKLIEFSAVVLTMGVIFSSWKKIRLSYLIYLILFFVVFVSSGNFTSFPRFILILWPVFLVFAEWGENFMFDFFYKLLSTMLLGLFTALFLAGFFVA